MVKVKTMKKRTKKKMMKLKKLRNNTNSAVQSMRKFCQDPSSSISVSLVDSILKVSWVVCKVSLKKKKMMMMKNQLLPLKYILFYSEI